MNFKHKYINRIRSRWFKLPFIWKLKFDFIIHKKKSKHNLPAPLIVSLTSYPARFKTLPKTLKCLLNQSLISDKVVLWIAFDDEKYLTKEIKKISNLEIRFCENLNSYKKIIPALQEFKDSFLVTADDDIYYRYNWLEELISNYNGNAKEIICFRAHQIVLNKNNLPKPYLQWHHPKTETEASQLIFPTNGAGTLFPPGVFFSEVTNQNLFLKLCPTSDDIWIWWMLRLNGCTFKKVGKGNRIYNSSKYNQIGLWHINLNQGQNDVQMQKMINYFGTEGVFI